MPYRFLQDLNEQQLNAVKATEGYVRVSAGAGTGKTRTLTYRYAYLLAGLGLSARSILCVTFTNKAAKELKQRVTRICGDLANPFVCTFHGFCAEFLRQECKSAGFPQNFSIFDVDDSKSVLRRIFEALKVNGRELSLKDAWEYIDGRKADISYGYDFICPDSERLLRRAQEGTSLLDKIFYYYCYQLRQQYALDFDDLITLTLIILHDFPEVRRRWQERLEYILVDEFQDIDALQYELVEILADGHHNLFIVGDPDQTIYSFRGAKVQFFRDFTVRHSAARCFYLQHNYRSQEHILDLAYTIISNNPDPNRKKLISHLTLAPSELAPVAMGALKEQDAFYQDLKKAVLGKTSLPRETPNFHVAEPAKKSALPVLMHVSTHDAEGRFIADEIKEIKALNPNASIAVLYRSRFVSGPIEKALIRAGIKYAVVSDVPFFMRAEIKDALSYLRLVINPDDNMAFLRVINNPRRGFGRSRQQRLFEYAEAEHRSLFASLMAHIADSDLKPTAAVRDFVGTVLHLNGSVRLGPLSEFERTINAFRIEEKLKQGGEEERLNNLNMLRDEVAQFEQQAGERTTIADFLQHAALFTTADTDSDDKSVILMTAHNAKGLEFDYVFIAALNEKIFPSVKSTSSEEIEEERRLLYVAATRARRQLFMTESSNYSVRDESCLVGSRFLSEMHDDEILELGGTRSKVRAGGGVEMSAHDFYTGDEVFSEIIGPGLVQSVDEKSGEYKIFFTELNQVRTMSFKAPLSLVKKGPEHP